MKTLRIAAISVALCSFLVAQNTPNRGPMPFSSFDLNNDGVITSEEFYKVRNDRMTQKAQQNMPMRNAANAPAFESMDKNKDGKITKEEFTEFRLERMKNNMKNKGQGMGMQQGKGMGMMNNK
ncbi:hypothetical protein CRV00_02505 [Malaciobacter molluscorum]|uniref:EF-hand domain-containing protein n=1 Tax=Malaciobacter molluscorum TaxID=1032072 RepID=UPI00100A9CBC|nr:EF-hand domain-containing protein [Malaciobacter molluscorum]RXJ96506.1 hypothetical protein CRV00_02505 [Malaciobacter molluscorum]